MSCKWLFLRTLPNCKGYDPWHHARTEFIWKYNSTDDHRWALNRQPPRKLCLQESLDQKTQCSFSILCASRQSMMRFYQFLCTDTDFSKKGKSPRLSPHVLSQRLVEFFISLKINLFGRILHKIPLLAWETITSHLYWFFQWDHWAWIPASYGMDDHLQPGVPIKTLPDFALHSHLNFEERTSIKNILKNQHCNAWFGLIQLFW